MCLAPQPEFRGILEEIQEFFLTDQTCIASWSVRDQIGLYQQARKRHQ
jgi:hypothetical protein